MMTKKYKKLVPKGFTPTKKYAVEPIPKLPNGRPETWTEEVIEDERKALEEWLSDERNYYLTKFASSRGYFSSWLDEMANKSHRFSLTLQRAREIFEARIVTNSLDRTMDGNFAKFVLANKAGWKEKQELSSSKEDPLQSILINIDGSTKEIVETIDTEDNK